MTPRLLARLGAALPPSLKYRLGAWRPLYLALLRAGSRQVTVRTASGSFAWVLDENARQTYILGTYEPYMQEALAAAVRPGDVVFDVGAHAGFHTLLAGLLCRPGGQVIAFEPDPRNVRTIRRHLGANPGLAARVLPCGISDADGTAAFAPGQDGAEGRLETEGRLTVGTATIDTLVASGRVPAPSVIKIDVEGHEARVLRGARRTLARARPVVLVDYQDHTTLDAVRAAVEGMDYSVAAGPPITARPDKR